MRKYLVICFAFVFLISLCYADGIDIGINTSRDKIVHNYGMVELPFETIVLQQTEVDSNYPCYVSGENEITCPAINKSVYDNIKSDLSIIDKIRYIFTDTIPIKNLDGKPISSGALNPYIENVIEVDLTKYGTFRIGFNSNEFYIGSYNIGVFNYTQENGGNIYLRTGYLNGNYYPRIIDLNGTYSILNVTYNIYNPGGSSVQTRLRSYNITMNEIGTLSEGLLLYLKMDGDNIGTTIGNDYVDKVPDFSGYNRTVVSKALTNKPSIEIDKSISGGSANFNAIGETLIINDADANFVEGLSGVTFGGWIYPRTNGIGTSYGRIIEQGTSTIEMNIEGNRKITCKGSYETLISPELSLNYNEWSHVLCVFNETAKKIFINGVLIAESDGITPTRTTTADLGIGNNPGGSRTFDGYIDEVIIYNRALNNNEVLQLYNQKEVRNWSSWSPYYTSSPSAVSIPDGRWVQIDAKITRPTVSDNVYIDSISMGYDTSGAAPPVIDNPPTVTLTTPDLRQFSAANITLNFTAIDVVNLKNASLWGNWTGTFKQNQTKTITGSNVLNYSSFNINVSDGNYKWNVYVCDNSSQCSFATLNRTFSVSTVCNPATCSNGFLCDSSTNACYTSCNSHDQVNSTSYCGNDAQPHPQKADGQSCSGAEFINLEDNNICYGGYCFNDNFEDIGEYCTSTSTNCVDEGTGFIESYIKELTSGNDYKMCIGGESNWSSTVYCMDGGTGVNPGTEFPSITGHDYCGYYSAQSVTEGVSGGCYPVLSELVNDCGYYSRISGGNCGSTASYCDFGCGATSDSDNCIYPNVLENNCTCTPPPPTEIDNPPNVNLYNPLDGSTKTIVTINFTYTVLDEYALSNCSLYLGTQSVAFGINQTVSTGISRTIPNGFNQVIFSNGTEVTWNVRCTDSLGNWSFANANWTFSIDTSTPTKYRFEIYNESSLQDPPIFSVDNYGLVNISSDLFVYGNISLHGNLKGLSPLIADNIRVIDYLDIDSAEKLKVILTNPYDEYLKIEGENKNGNILFGLFKSNPTISTDSGDRIVFKKLIEAENGITVDNGFYIEDDTINFNGGGNIFIGADREYAISGYNLTIESPSSSAIPGNLILSGGTDVAGFRSGKVLINYVDNALGDVIMAEGSKVGIGTASPTHKLNVLGNTNITGDLDLGSNIAFKKAGTFITNAFGYLVVDGTDLYLRANTNRFITIADDTNAKIIMGMGGGYVGIGTASPTHQLSILGTTGNMLNISGTLGEITTEAGARTFKTTAVPRSDAYGYAPVTIDVANMGGENRHLFDVGIGGSPRFTIDEDGDGYFVGSVGIGTGSPAVKLDVVGGIKANYTLSGGGVYGINAIGGNNFGMSGVSGAVLGTHINSSTYGALGWNDILGASRSGVFGSQGTGNYAGYFSGEVYVTGNLSAENVIDRSKWCELDGENSLTYLASITNKGELIDKTTMPPCSIVEIQNGNETVLGRDLGAYTSYLTQVSQELNEKLNNLTQRVEEIERNKI